MSGNDFWNYYEERVANIGKHYRLALELGAVESIHDLRVEIKRLRAFVKFAAKLAPTLKTRKVLSEARKLFKAAGAVRDIQVQMTLVYRLMTEEKLDISEYYNYLKEKELAARGKFVRSAGNFNLRSLTEFGRYARKELAEADAGELLEKTGKILSQAVAALNEYDSTADSSDDFRHQIRIRCKESRYILEIIRSCAAEDKRLEDLNEGLRSLHRALGKWHDYDIGLKTASDFITDSARQPFFDQSSYNIFINRLESEKNEYLQKFENLRQKLTPLVVP